MLSTALAQINLLPPGEFNALGEVTFEGLVSAAVRFVLLAAALVFFFMLIIGGVRWIFSGGDKTQTESARNQITAALVGLVIVFSAWALVTLINALFQVNIFNLDIPNTLG